MEIRFDEIFLDLILNVFLEQQFLDQIFFLTQIGFDQQTLFFSKNYIYKHEISFSLKHVWSKRFWVKKTFEPPKTRVKDKF